jgi:enoyl-CoA hydratase/carnithine racemase
MSWRAIRFEVRGVVAWISLNRPEALNAYNTAMRDELFEALAAVDDDTDLRALVIRGEGRAFCAGADLREFGTAPSPTVARQVRFARDVWGRLDHLRVPTISALHGFVFGSGLEMALFCDLRVAAEGTEFRMPEVQLGLIPAAGGTQTLPRVCGQGAALELLLTGRRFDADEALRLGLVSQVVAPERLLETAEALAERLAALEPRVVAAVRQAVREGLDLPLADGLRLEARLAAEIKRPESSV